MCGDALHFRLDLFNIVSPFLAQHVFSHRNGHAKLALPFGARLRVRAVLKALMVQAAKRTSHVVAGEASN